MIKKLMHVTTKELEEILDIWLMTTIEAHSFVSETYWRKNRDLVREQLPQANLYVAMEQKTIVAFMGIMETYIAGIFVKNDFQGQGIGQLLLKEAKDANSQLNLSVYAKNQNAFQFYLKQGFKIINEQTDDTGELEYQMIWNK